MQRKSQDRSSCIKENIRFFNFSNNSSNKRMKASSQFPFISQRLINNLKIKVQLQRNVTIELKSTFLSSSSARKIKLR